LAEPAGETELCQCTGRPLEDWFGGVSFAAVLPQKESAMTIGQRPLGATGATVSVLGFGSMELRGAPRGPNLPDEVAGRILNETLDAGINFIDTSIDYGKSEQLIGRYIGHRRGEFFLASKCGCIPDDPRLAGYPHNYSRTNVRAGVENSLRRIGTDHLDLVQIHVSPTRAELEANDTVAEMFALKAEGKVRFLGISGQQPDLADHLDMGVFDVFQIPYSVVQREHEALIARARALGAGTVIRGGTARGNASAEKNWQRGVVDQAAGEARRRWDASRIEEVLEGMPAMEFVLRFTISHPAVCTTIVGTSSIEHLRANVSNAAKGPLPADLYEEAKRRFPMGDA
jgi:aryl-alcohol dehydrogenase-like predicted oxidoreductase